MARLLAVASIAWPLVMGAAVASHASRPGDLPLWTRAVYAASARICHQRPERSFHTAGVQWPVCARCSGLYLAAPVGAIAAVLAFKRRPDAVNRRARVWLLVAAVPTAVTVLLEWMALAPMSNTVRAIAALPLGALIAFVIVRMAAGAREAIG